MTATLVVVDSGQIEARVAAWFARESQLLETFRRNDAKTVVWEAAVKERVRQLGREPTKDEAKAINRELAELGIAEGDFYSDVGGTFFGKKLSKSETPIERQLSKAMILGLGFSMGVFTFAGNLPGVTQTMPLAVYQALERDPEAAVALSLVLLVVSIGVLALLRERWLHPGATL